MRDVKAKVSSNKNIRSNYYRITMDAPYIARHAKPGQFVQIRCSDSLDPLLRRPFSIHRLKASLGSARDRQGFPRLRSGQARLKGIEILYEVIGKGTEILSKKKTGDILDVLGPLGNGFTLPRTTPVRRGGDHEGRTTILIAGGIGVAPLVFLAEELAREEIKATILIGAKTKEMLLCEKDFKKTGAEVYIATDDGTRGYKGFVTKLLEKILRTTSVRRGGSDGRERNGASPKRTIYACGPPSMLQRIAWISGREQVESEVSLEENMACGIGACLGCAVKVRGDRYKLACKDGPVFNTSELEWN